MKGQDECEGPPAAVTKTPIASAPGEILCVLTLKMSICGLFNSSFLLSFDLCQQLYRDNNVPALERMLASLKSDPLCLTIPC